METLMPLVYLAETVLCLNRTMQYGNGAEWHKNTRGEVGLNRTMQYGNNYTDLARVSKQYGLNRTMQYGNLSPTCIRHRFRLCLNRTMQYGNQYLQYAYREFPSRFKSYYVVWKLHQFPLYMPTHCQFKSYYVVWKPRKDG